jgi:endogenous inhibitor of DNA gyrase (YacG/DUF329 family)
MEITESIENRKCDRCGKLSKWLNLKVEVWSGRIRWEFLCDKCKLILRV